MTWMPALLALISPSPTPSPSPPIAFDGTVSLDTIIQGVLAIVTLVGIAYSIWFAQQGLKQSQLVAAQEADRAQRAENASEASAERAEKASAITIDTLSRMADGVEGLVFHAEGLIEVVDDLAGADRNRVAQVRGVRWSLVHSAGDTYKLENIGDRTAQNVEIHMDESVYIPGRLPSGSVIAPGEAMTFMAALSLATRDSTVTVQWEDEGAMGEWRYPLPPRPRRR